MLQRIYHEENKKQAMEWENFFANPVTDKGLVPRLYKEFSQFSSKKTVQLNNRQKMNRHFSKEGIK